MLLTLVRHGEAALAINGDDSKRPLTERGRIQAQQTADVLRSQFEQNQRLEARSQPDVFVVSTLLRAQQTLSYLSAHYPDVPVVICNHIKPEDDAQLALDWLSQLPYEHIVVVCHMNVVGYLAELITHDQFDAFALAESRIYSQHVLAAGLSTELKRFIPSA